MSLKPSLLLFYSGRDLASIDISSGRGSVLCWASEFLATGEGWIQKVCVDSDWDMGLRRLLVYVLCESVPGPGCSLKGPVSTKR